MKKFSAFIVLIAFGALSLSAQTAPDPSIDPTGTLAALQGLDDGCQVERDAIVAAIEFDQHPVHGTILAEDYPVHAGGFSYAQLEDHIVDGATKVEVAHFEYSGIALVEHKIGDEIVHVWHRYDAEPAVLIVSENQNNGGGPVVALSLYGCGNAGYVLDWKFDWYLIGQILGRW